MNRRGPTAAFAATAVLAFAAAGAAAAESGHGGSVGFVEDIQPIFQQHCYECHGKDKSKAGLSFATKRRAFMATDSGEPAIKPGKPAKSELIRRVTHDDPGERMPKDADPLPAEKIKLLRQWIAQGANWPQSATEDNRHWAFVPPQRPELPEVENDAWVRTPIDRFVLAKLEEEGLSPSKPADKAKLLRRLYLDLIGLPPSVKQIRRFVEDDSPDAYREAVDRLLNSPRFGEKWARQWLDAARYADSNGYQADQLRTIWPYRDWVIQAINEDKPYDRFTVEQIAGDLLPDATQQTRIATGFNRTVPTNVEAGVDPEENRVNQVFDRVDTMGTVFLGMTIHCAQCHNHKYDPVSQKEYYQLFDFFNQTPIEVKKAAKGENVTRYDFYGPKMKAGLSVGQKARKRQLTDRLQKLRAEENRLIRQRMDKTDGRRAWLEQLRRRVETVRRAHAEEQPTQIVRVESEGGAEFRKLDDGSYLVKAKTAPKHDRYTVVAKTALPVAGRVKLEALSHESLPRGGPGLGPDNGNFVLGEFSASVGSSADAEQIDLTRPRADYEQNGWPLAQTLDGKLRTGWAIRPQTGKDHWARYRFNEPVRTAKRGRYLRFEMRFTDEWAKHAIGRFRLSVQPPALDSVAPETVRKALTTPRDQRTDQQRKTLRRYYATQQPAVRRVRSEIAGVKEKLEAIDPATTLMMVRRDEPRQTHLMKRGNFRDPGPKVEGGVPKILHDWPDGAPRNRLGLAKWLVDENNPLIGRVTINRWWQKIFGAGLVRTPEDFGTQGRKPTHPKLLDWLAVELVEEGWSRKQMIRTIVTSATYRQSARISDELRQRDPYNKLLARGPRFRMPAEMVRDNALKISGLLVDHVGGPPVYPPQPPGLWDIKGRNQPDYATDTGADRFRRGVYVIWRRGAHYASFDNFDAPARSSCTVRRSRTNTPLQALTLMNDPAYVEAGLAFAERIAADAPATSVPDRVRWAFRACVARQPDPQEVEHLANVYRRAHRRLKKNPSAARTLLKQPGGWSPNEGADRVELAAWFRVATILLNLDETITKG